MKIGIVGVGGIGSNVAANLVRSGVCHLKIIDFDRVEPSNLNRQFYFRDQIGRLKVEMLEQNLCRIRTDVCIEAVAVRIDAANCQEILADCRLIVEGLDRKSDKKMLLETLSGKDRIIVSASGIAGHDIACIRVKQLGGCYIVGDFVTDCTRASLFAHKVSAVANIMTDIILREGGYMTDRNQLNGVLPCGIYGITAEKFSAGRTNVEVVRAMIAGGIRIIQYREKRPTKSFSNMLDECQQIRLLTREADVLLIINDYVDIAQMVDADGVHVGQDDFPVAAVRRLIGPGKIIGLSTHSPEQAAAAVLSGADYIGVGPIFCTTTKEDVCAPVGVEYLDHVVHSCPLPFVAIGGIKENNLDQVIRHGAKTICLVTEIVGALDIAAKVRRLQATLSQ